VCNFIKKIRIKNFFSVKNEVEIDFKADEYTIQNHKNRLFEYNHEYYNKLISFYGANAVGKTTILKAIVFVSFIISNKTNNLPIHYANIYSESSYSYIEIEFVFDNKEFSYFVEFKLNKDLIVGIKNEILKLNNDIIIDRKSKILKNFQKEDIGNEILFEKISDRRSLIIEATTRTNDYDKLVEFFDNVILLSNIKGVYDVAMQLSTDENLLLATLFSNERNFLINDKVNNLNKIGFYKFVIKAMQIIGIDIKEIRSNIELRRESVNIEFSTIHNINIKKRLPFNLESHGTQMLIRLLFDLYFAYENNVVLIIDELDSILHPMIVPYFLLIAVENNIQFIYSTHNIYNLKFLFKDEIFLIEKDNEHNTKILLPKNDKQIKGYENLLALYEENILGGVPEIRELVFDIGAMNE